MAGVFEGLGQSVGSVVGGTSSGVVTGLPGGLEGAAAGGTAGAFGGAVGGAAAGAVGGLGIADVVTVPAGAATGAISGGLVGSAVGAGVGFAPGFSQGYAVGATQGATIGSGYGQSLDNTWLGRKINAMVKGNDDADKQKQQDQTSCSGSCAKTPADVLKDATRDGKKPTLKDGTDQYNKPGGLPQADQDFDSMQPQNVTSPDPGVRIGTLGDGTQVIVRPQSVPSLEINPPAGTPSIIRYK